MRGRRDPLSVLKGTDIEGLDLLPADFSYRHLDIALDQAQEAAEGVSRVLDPLAEHYDVAILDCPPSISLVSENVFTAADAAARPARAVDAVGAHVRAAATFLADGPQPAPAVVAFLSMVDRRRRLHRELAASLPETLPEVARARSRWRAPSSRWACAARRWSPAIRAARRPSPTRSCGPRSLSGLGASRVGSSRAATGRLAAPGARR